MEEDRVRSVLLEGRSFMLHADGLRFKVLTKQFMLLHNKYQEQHQAEKDYA
jgi:hypothetical protein